MGNKFIRSSLEELTDVNITTPPADGDTIVYDAATKLWVPGPSLNPGTFVPYSGATGNVNLGTHSIAASNIGTAAAKAASNNSDANVASVTGATTNNHFAYFADTAGTVKDGGSPATVISGIAVTSLNGQGPGAISQTSTGGTIAISGLNHEVIALDVAAAGPITAGAPVYNNGTAGVGATLTATINGAFSLDGVGVNGYRYLITGGTSNDAYNGVYVLTTTGSSGSPYVLTRATDFDTTASAYTGKVYYVTGGAYNSGSTWRCQQAGTIGSSIIEFTKLNGSFADVQVDDNLNVGGNTILDYLQVTHVPSNSLVSTDSSGYFESPSIGNGLNFSSNTLECTVVSNGVNGDVQVADGSGGFIGNTDFYFDTTNQVLGIQTGGNPQAVVHAISNTAKYISSVSPPSGYTNNESDIPAPSGDDVQQGSPMTVGAYNGNASQQSGYGDYTANGSTYTYYAYDYGSGGLYSPAYAIGSFTDDNSGSPFTSEFTWNNSTSGGSYDGTLLGLSINGGSIQWYDAGNIGGSYQNIYDNGSGSPYNWGSSGGPGTTSPDFISNGSTYSFNCYGIGTSPSGNSYYIEGDNPSWNDGGTGQPIGVQLYNSNSIPVSFNEVTPNGSVGYIVAPYTTETIYTNTANDGQPTGPSFYGYSPDSGNPQYYRLTPYGNVSSGRLYGNASGWAFFGYSSTYTTWYAAGSNPALPSGAVGYILEHSSDGSTVDRWADIGNNLAWGDDALGVTGGSWNSGAHNSTPTAYVPPAGHNSTAATYGDYSNGTNPTEIVQSFNPTDGSPYTKYVDSNGDYLGKVGIFNWGGNATMNLAGAHNAAVQNDFTVSNYTGIYYLMFGPGDGSGNAINMQLGEGYPFLNQFMYAGGLNIQNPGYTAFLSVGGAIDAYSTGCYVPSNFTQGNGSYNNNSTQTIVSGSIGGEAVFYQYMQGQVIKRVIIMLLSGFQGTASYTFPTAFNYTPDVLGSNAALVTSVSTTSVTVTSATAVSGKPIELYGS